VFIVTAIPFTRGPNPSFRRPCPSICFVAMDVPPTKPAAERIGGNRKANVRVRISDDGLELQFLGAFSSEDLSEVKSIPGRRWDRDRRVWILPATAESLQMVQELFGRHITLEVEASRLLETDSPGAVDSSGAVDSPGAANPPGADDRSAAERSETLPHSVGPTKPCCCEGSAPAPGKPMRVTRVVSSSG
jgi:hypothetical protein